MAPRHPPTVLLARLRLRLPGVRQMEALTREGYAKLGARRDRIAARALAIYNGWCQRFDTLPPGYRLADAYRLAAEEIDSGEQQV